MIIRCKNCGGALMYDMTTGKMRCRHCDSVFAVEDVDAEGLGEKMMYGNICVCTACAGEMLVNSVESATYCAYCGQPTIVFERVSKTLRPDKILTFKLTKEEAVDIIRKKFKKKSLIPKEIKNFEVERIKPIYIPYWLYDIKASCGIEIHDEKGGHEKWSQRDWKKVTLRREFEGFTVDASSVVDNEMSSRLEPFDISELKDFEEGYLSGAYADKFDQDSSQMKAFAIQKCEELFLHRVNHIKSSIDMVVNIHKPVPQFDIKKEEYILLPIWFMTLRYKDTPYTIMVNGQNGKIAGAVPILKGKVILWSLIYLPLSALLAIPGGWIIRCSIESILAEKLTQKGVGIWFLFWIVVVFLGAFDHIKSMIKDLKCSMAETSSRKLEDFAKNRQEGEGL